MNATGALQGSEVADKVGDDASMSSLGGLDRKMRRGSRWAMGGYVVSQTLRLGSNLILWRLLVPEAFGVMAIVNAFMQGVKMFTDIGVGPAIIQSEHGDDPDYLNTIWTIQTVRGFVLFLITAALAQPMAAFYEQDELLWLIPAVGLGMAVMGFASTRPFTATRHVTLGRRTLMDLIAQASGLGAAIGLAAVTRSVWALVVGGLVTSLAHVALTHTFLPGIRNRFHFDRRHARAMMRFGRWIFLSTVLTFIVGQADRLIFGKVITMEELGVFSIAAVWANLPALVVISVLSSVVFPVLSRVHGSAGDFRAAFVESRLPWLVFGGWLTTCLVAGGPALIRFLYDERALEATWIVQVLAAGAWFRALHQSNHSALLAQGRASSATIPNAGKLFSMLALLPIGLYYWGFVGGVLALTVTDLVRYVCSVVVLARGGVSGLFHDVGLSLCVFLTGAAGLWIATYARSDWLPHLGEASTGKLGVFLEGLLVFVVVGAVWAVLRVSLKKKLRPSS